MRYFVTFSLCYFLGFGPLWATDYRAGEITFKHKGGLTYEILVTTYTKISSEVDRCEIEIDFGDGTTEIVDRSNTITPNFLDCVHGNVGVIISGRDIKINEYVTTHTFPAQYSYTISIEDLNRNGDIRNIPGSISIPLSLKSELLVSETNSSPIMRNLPIDEGCVGRIFEHNPGALDAEGDSLVYSLIRCSGLNGLPIPNYSFPNEVSPGPNNQLSIDANTGTLIWESPALQGEYNVCILIEEFRRVYRSEIDYEIVKVGSVVRDMQITIGVCSHQPPKIEALDELCVVAGEQVNVTVKATDPDGDGVKLTAVGEPLEVPFNPALFVQPASGTPSATQDFLWDTDCSHVRNQPYQVVFKAQDFGRSTELVDFEVLRIKVIAPAPASPQAIPLNKEIHVSWDASICTTAVGYKVYRHEGFINYQPDDCVTGVPSFTNYILVGTTSGWSNTIFEDDNDGAGLLHGRQYCYMIVAEFADGAESLPSVEVCSELKRDVPVITRVSVNVTDLSSGSDTIVWTKPTELDTDTQFIGPYHYRIYRSEIETSDMKLVGQTGTAATLDAVDSVFVDDGLNTSEVKYYYQVELFSDGIQGVPVSTGISDVASSVYLTSTSFDNELRLTWGESVPWTNRQYVVFRLDEDLGSFIPLDTVNVPFYTDAGLKNLREYSYFVRSIGAYSSPGFIDPILNNSQIHVGIPEDATAPCAPPNPKLTGDCNLGESVFTWSNPNTSCAEVDDVIGYNIYFTPVMGGPFELLKSFQSLDATDTSLTQINHESIAGCYVVTAVDSFLNESDFSQPLCIDNCPNYELPNVFTPGGDGVNDFFRPFPYKFVESIELEVYNRWGQKVFETTEPEIKWDGTDMNDNRPLESGVYFYVCTVNEIRLVGIVPRVLKGYVHILKQKDFRPSGN